MSLISKLFKTSGSTDMDQDLPWKALNEEAQLAEIKENSKTKTQIIFKHSTRCGISSMVMNRFKKAYDLSENQADLYYLDLISFRAVSNAIADTFGVRHESPQLLIVKQGTVVKHDSHSGINEIDLDQYV